MNEKAQIYLQSINYGKNVFMALPDQNEGHLPQDPGTPACEEDDSGPRRCAEKPESDADADAAEEAKADAMRWASKG